MLDDGSGGLGEPALETLPALESVSLRRNTALVDVAALEEFADECGVPQLRLCFTPLRQLLNASLDRNASSSAGNGAAGWAKSEALRLSLFPQLDADTLIAVLGKVHGLPMVSKMKFGQQQQRSAYDLPALDHRSASELVKQIQASTGM